MTTPERRVAHVLRKYDPAQWGGTETHVAAVTRELSGRGWEVEVHAPRGPTAADSSLAPEVALRRYAAFCPFVGSGEARRALYANGGNIASLDEPARLARDGGLALAHVHALGRIAGGVRTAMRLTGRPYVVSLHGPVLADSAIVAADTALRHRRAWDLGSPIGLLFGSHRVLDDAARIIVFNDEERAAMAARFGERAVRMDHGVDAARFGAGDEARARARWPELGGSPVITLVGRISAQKNQLLAVRAFARGAPADHRLTLAGAETDRGYRSAVEREAHALGVADRVHFLGNLPPEEIPDLLARSILVVAPSTHETFGLMVPEAWAANRPVLFARRSALVGMARALRDDAVAVPSLEVAEWAAELRRLLSDEASRRAAAEAGAELVRARFGWKIVGGQLARLYEEILQSRRPAR
jgi:D-inositol-3-phosphate glycosyltransferase